jgi:hypothetical protein
MNAGDPAGQGLSAATMYPETSFPTASHFDWKDHIFVNDSGGDNTVVTPPALPNNGKVDGVRICSGSDQRVGFGCQPVFTVNANPAFSGAIGAGFGDYMDQHLSIVSPDPRFYSNNPITGLPTLPFYVDFGETNVQGDEAGLRRATLASGATRVYKLTTGGDTLDNKRLPLEVWSGPYKLADVSGPGRVLSDNSADFYHFCIAAVNGECWAASIAGERYANIPYTVIPTVGGAGGLSCGWPGGGGGPPLLDACPFVLGSHQGKFTQYGMQRQDRFGTDSRAITYGLQAVRRSGGNTRVIPSGDWMILPNDIGAPGDAPWNGLSELTILLAKTGAFPPYSSVNRTDFIPLPVPITAKTGATTAVVDYGFDENFHCSSRADGCVANGNATSDPNPYYWGAEAYTGKACASGCTINIPAISGRTVYYRTRWLSGGSTVATGKTQVVAVP